MLAGGGRSCLLQRMIDSVDADESGTVSFREFVHLVQVQLAKENDRGDDGHGAGASEVFRREFKPVRWGYPLTVNTHHDHRTCYISGSAPSPRQALRVVSLALARLFSGLGSHSS